MDNIFKNDKDHISIKLLNKWKDIISDFQNDNTHLQSSKIFRKKNNLKISSIHRRLHNKE